ncbi:unnamed protein product [Orchesella dallaii]|uniref:Uncharacterized protein n=1 Tax=Orchesella dallaii TaxID=48710 RepID=A0ABP1PPT9_9HEXA
MRSQVFSVAVALFSTALLLEGTTADIEPAIKRDISELSSVERLLFRLTHPEQYNAWFPKSGSKSPSLNYDYGLFDFFNIDFPILSLQFSKAGSVLLPSLHIEYGFYFCLVDCVGFLQYYDFREPEIKNANLTSLTTKINSTSLEVEFTSPDFQLIMEKFGLVDSDLGTNHTVFWRGLSVFLGNLTTKLSANLEFVPGVGLQLSNTTMGGGVDDFRIRVENATHNFPDGTSEEWGEEEINYTADFNAGWVSYGEKLEAHTETWLNCFLSEGRNGNEECEGYLNDKIQRHNFVLLVEAIGLGIAHEEDGKEKKELEEKTPLLPLLLPEFPFPSIESTLLDFPTLLLQLSKIFGPDYNDYLVTYLPLTYDFVRQNCSSGVCHNIRELMFLPAFLFGGLPNNEVQIDIQPNNFSLSLKVPNVYFNGDELQHETQDLDSGFREFYLGVHLTVVDCEFAISGDYELKEGVGLQVSNLGLTLRLGELQMSFPQYFTVNNGETSDPQTLNFDIAPQIMAMWSEVDENGVSFERRYEEHIQNLINNYLAENQSSL